MNLMVTTNQKSITDIHTEKKNPNITLNIVIKSRQKLQKKGAENNYKTNPNNGQSGRETHASRFTLNVNELSINSKI